MTDDDGRNGIKHEQAGKTPNSSGFWGRATSGRDYANPKAREHSREDYGATNHGGEEAPSAPAAGERNPAPANGSEPRDNERDPTGS